MLTASGTVGYGGKYRRTDEIGTAADGVDQEKVAGEARFDTRF